MDLHMYRGECDTIIATSEEDALAVYIEYTGSTNRDDAAEELGALRRLDPEKSLKIFIEHENRDETKTVAEWIAANGRGFLCSTEW